MGIPRRALEIAAKQGGFATRDQLLSCGLSASAIDRRVNAGHLVVVSPGIYQVFPTAGHVDLLRGAILALPDPVISHQSAAFMLDFPILPTLEPTVTVASHTTHSFPGVTVRRADDLVSSHVTRVEGMFVTNVARTTFDLGRILEFREFENVADALILEGRLQERHLRRITDDVGRKGKPGTRAARDFLAMRGGAHQGSTVLERRGRELLARGGLPAPSPQFPIPWSPGHRFDDAYPPERLAIEWDSRAWHLQRAAMERDRKRDREAALHGWYVIRFTWEDVTKRPAEVVDTVARLLVERRVG
jgi:hypothetical protein